MALGRQDLLIAVAAASIGCGVEPPPGPPHRALVVDIDQVVDGQPSFVLAERELETVTDFDALTSRFFRVLRGGTLTVREVAGSVVVDPEFSGADEPDLRYQVSGGAAIPRDYSTLAMVSAAYQLERVMLSLEQAFGLSAIEIVVRGGRYELLFEPTLRSEGDITATVTPKFNAFFLPGGVRQFGLARRSQFEQLPIAVSPLVIAHEFGHGLFELGFEGGVTPSCDEDAANDEIFFPGRFQIEHAISGFNEGWADFVSFAIHGTVDPLVGVGFDTDTRNMAATTFTFSEISPLNDCVCCGSFYCIGTVFARSLYQAFLAGGGDPADGAGRGAYASEIFAALSGTQAAMRERGELPAAGPFLRDCEVPAFDDFDLGVDGPVSSAFLGAFVESLEPALRGDVCAALIANFGDVGFATDSRDACP